MKNTQSNFEIFANKLIVILIKIIYYFLKLFKKDYWNHHHLIVTIKDWKFSISWIDHASYAKEKEAHCNNLKTKLAPEDFVKEVFEECKKCNFVVFGFEKKSKKYLQFWLGDNSIKFDYPMIKDNQLGKYKYQVLGLLAESGFYRVN